MLSYYHQQYEEQNFLRQMDSIKQQNSFYNYNEEKEYFILSSSNSSSSSSAFVKSSKNKTISRKIGYLNDDSSSFYHTMHISVKKRRTSSPLHQSFEDSSCLPLPNICSTILASKLYSSIASSP
jgi:hypothetical protein